MKIRKDFTTEQIQKYIRENRQVEFEKGTYNITSQIVVPSNTTIDLNGSKLVRRNNIQSIFLSEAKPSTTRYNGATNIVIENGTLEDMGSNTPDNLITFFHASDCKLLNLTFLDSRCHALELNGCNKICVSDCKFLGHNPASPKKELLQLDFCGVSGFWLKGSTKSSPCYDGTHNNDITIRECEFNKSSSRGLPSVCIGQHAMCSNGEKHSNIIITENHFECGGINKNAPAINLLESSNVTVVRNGFQDCGRALTISTSGNVYNLDGSKASDTLSEVCDNVYFAENYVKTKTSTLKCVGVLCNGLHKNIVVINNFIYGNSTSKYATSLGDSTGKSHCNGDLKSF